MAGLISKESPIDEKFDTPPESNCVSDAHMEGNMEMDCKSSKDSSLETQNINETNENEIQSNANLLNNENIMFSSDVNRFLTFSSVQKGNNFYVPVDLGSITGENVTYYSANDISNDHQMDGQLHNAQGIASNHFTDGSNYYLMMDPNQSHPLGNAPMFVPTSPINVSGVNTSAFSINDSTDAPTKRRRKRKNQDTTQNSVEKPVRDEQKRFSHNEVERARRLKINALIKRLADLTTQNTNLNDSNNTGSAASKGKILARACDYIAEMQVREQHFIHLIEENKMLRAELMRYQSNLAPQYELDNMDQMKRDNPMDMKVEVDFAEDSQQKIMITSGLTSYLKDPEQETPVNMIYQEENSEE